MPPVRAAAAPVATIKQLERVVVEVPIVGEMPLITRPFSQKAIGEIEDAQAGKTRKKKPPKNPVEEYELSKYRLSDGRYGVPAAGFKSGIVGAVGYFKGITKIDAKKIIWIVPDDPITNLVAIEHTDPWMRTDHVRNETGVADIRYRPQFDRWRATLKVGYVADILTLDQVVSLVDAAGLGGICEWRPSAPKNHGGNNGTFHVRTAADGDEL